MEVDSPADSQREVASLRVNSIPPVTRAAAPACLPSGRKIVDLSGVSFPNNSCKLLIHTAFSVFAKGLVVASLLGIVLLLLVNYC